MPRGAGRNPAEKRRGKTIVAIGEALWDLFPQGAMLGGAPLNFAYRSHCLGDRGVLATRIGRDARGREARTILRKWGMETHFVQSDPGRPTGSVELTLDEQGNPDFHIVPDAAFDYLSPTPKLLALVRSADCVCFGTLIQRTEAGRQSMQKILLRAEGALRLYDINLRPDCYTMEVIAASLRHADLLKLNLQEAHFLADHFEISAQSLPEFCHEMTQRWELQCCVITLGAHGVFAATRDDRVAYEPGYRVRVADTCGAGDACTAGFAHAYLRRRPLHECCKLGNGLGAIVASRPGGTAHVTRADLKRFISGEHPRIVEPHLKKYVQ